jgi:hypothetical protein
MTGGSRWRKVRLVARPAGYGAWAAPARLLRPTALPARISPRSHTLCALLLPCGAVFGFGFVARTSELSENRALCVAFLLAAMEESLRAALWSSTIADLCSWRAFCAGAALEEPV